MSLLLSIAARNTLLAQGLSPQKQLTQYSLRSWSTDEGSPSTAVLDILQTRDRFVWLATFNGLARFDGVRFTVYNRSTTPAIQSAGFYCLAEDSSGAVWAGSTSDNGLYQFSQGTFKTYTKQHNLASGTIHSLLFEAYAKQPHNQEARNQEIGTLWIGTLAGLQKARVRAPQKGQDFDRERQLLSIESIEALSGMQIWALHQDSEGMLWVGTRGRGIYRIEKSGKISAIASVYGKNANAVSFARGIGDTLWVAGLEQGLGYIVGNRHHSLAHAVTDDIRKSAAVRKVYTDRHKTLWVGMVNEPLTRHYHGKISAFAQEDKLTNVEALREDAEGNLWIGTYYTALSCLSDGKFTNYTTNEGLSNPLVHYIYRDTDSSIWIGTNKGLNRLSFDKNRIARFDHFTAENSSLPDNTVRHVLRDSRGRLWIATFGGLVCWEGKNKKTYTTKDGLTYNEVRLIFEDAQGTIWVGTRKGLNVVKEHKGKISFVGYSRENGNLSHDYFLSISQDSKGTMWFGTDGGGAISYRNGVFRSYTISEGLPANVVFQVYEDSRRKLWIATVNGIARLDDERRGIFSVIGSEQGLPGTVIFDMTEDKKETFWLTTPEGVLSLPRNELMKCADGTIKKVLFTRFTKTDGMSATECTGASKMYREGNTIWFPTLNGVSVINTFNVQHNGTLPAVYIDRIVADGLIHSVYDSLAGQKQQVYSAQLKRLTDTLRLPAGTRSIEFEYTGLSMISPMQNRFRVRLEKFDTDWIDVGTRRKAYYTNLPPGKYRFRVISSNNDKTWNSESAEIIVEIAPYFFQTWWFFGLCVVVGIGAVYAAYYFRVRHLRRQQKHLQRLVEERTQHIQEQTEEILRQQVILEEQSRNIEIANAEIQERNIVLHNTNEQLQELGELKNEMIRVVAHDLKNPLSSIILSASRIERFVSRMTAEELTSQAERIRLVGERMTKIILDLLDIDALESGTMNLELVPQSLGELTRIVLDEVAVLAQNKGIRIDYHDYTENDTVLVDNRAMQQIANNILSNALKFSPPDSTIYVRLWNPETETVRLEIQDEGPGISDDDKKRLFRKFTRLSAQPTAGEHSSGLGLSIVKRLVDAMRGSVQCESEPGKGTTFIVEMSCRSGQNRNGLIQRERAAALC